MAVPWLVAGRPQVFLATFPTPFFPFTSFNLKEIPMPSVTKWMLSVLALALVAWPRFSPCASLSADTSASELVIRTARAGLLSALAHNHQFTPATWRAEVEFDPHRPQELRVDVRIDASTLHDHVERLSPKMREYVDRETAGPEVLDAQHYREIPISQRVSERRDRGRRQRLRGSAAR